MIQSYYDISIIEPCDSQKTENAIVILKEMKGDLKAVRKSSDTTLAEIKSLKDDIQPGYASQFRQMQADVRAIKERLGMP